MLFFVKASDFCEKATNEKRSIILFILQKYLFIQFMGLTQSGVVSMSEYYFIQGKRTIFLSKRTIFFISNFISKFNGLSPYAPVILQLVQSPWFSFHFCVLNLVYFQWIVHYSQKCMNGRNR